MLAWTQQVTLGTRRVGSLGGMGLLVFVDRTQLDHTAWLSLSHASIMVAKGLCQVAKVWCSRNNTERPSRVHQRGSLVCVRRI